MEKEKAITIWLEDPRIERDGDLFTAYCDQLELAGCGITSDNAEQNLDEVILTSLRALAEEGILGETLDKRKIIYKEVPTQKTDGMRPLKPILVGR